jgi:diguanylate cyclase (GGDEF)-like protein
MRTLSSSRILSALDIAVFERVDYDRFALIGEKPDWLCNFCLEPNKNNLDISLSKVFPFLESFMIEFEEFWQSRKPGFLKSGLWTETDTSALELHLEASAFNVDGTDCIMIELSKSAYKEKKLLLQSAREDALNSYFDRKQAAENLKKSTLYDPLTGLPNLTYFTIKLAQKLEFSKQTKNSKFATVCLNIDRFQVVNSSLGHELADRLLLSIAWRIQKSLSSEDIICRVAGDEFAILFDNLDELHDSISRTTQILSSIKESFDIDGHTIFITASAGIAPNLFEYEKVHDLLRDANTAMHHAKTYGRGHHVMFERNMYTQAVQILQLENDLRQALQRNEFRVFYQPIISVSSNKVVGFEALVRWLHPERGLILPGLFLPLAEENDLILDIDLWIFREVSSHIKQWQTMATYPITININLSAKQFEQINFIEAVQSIMAESCINPSNIKFEITESSMLKNTKTVISRLHQLKEAGFSLSIDDFGTGYSSLSYLQYLPINSLKIDACFIKMISDNNAYLVESISKIAHSLGIDVTAEGVETPEQYEVLKTIGCEYAQGYLFAKPVCREDAIKLIDKDFSDELNLDYSLTSVS